MKSGSAISMLPMALWVGCVDPEGSIPTVETLETLALAEAIAEKGAAAWPAETLPFDWMQTVWATGVHDLYRETGGADWLDYNRRWMVDAMVDFDSDAPPSFTSSDSLSPAAIASATMVDDPSLDLTPITDAATVYLEDVPRVGEGAMVHWGPDNLWGFPSDQVWIDSLYMIGMFMLREFERTADRAWIDAFVFQYLAFSELCRDPETQLYLHAWDEAAGTTIPTDSVYWARGNAWVLLAGAELLSQVEPDDVAWNQVQPLFAAHAAALVAVQEDDGLWATVLGSPDVADPSLASNYTETSGSALIVAGLHRGWAAGALDDESTRRVIADAVSGLEERIEEDSGGPVVTGTSFGTNPGDYENYVEVPQLDDLILGVGAMLVGLVEVHGMEVPR